MPHHVGELGPAQWALPCILPLRPIERVFPSLFASLSICPLMGCGQVREFHTHLLPAPPESYVGYIAHATLEKVAFGAVKSLGEINEYWESQRRYM